MGRSVNKVQLIGTLGRDPEIRAMPSGGIVATISLATDESYTDKNTGQKVDQTEWHRIIVFGKLAEICQQYLFKGSKAYFEGKLKTSEYEKDGIKRYTTSIIANDMMLLTPRQGLNGMPPQGQYQQPVQQYQQPAHPQHQPIHTQGQQQYAAHPQPVMQPEYFDDDIQF